MEMKRNGNIRASEEGTLSYMYISVERMKNNLNGRVAISQIYFASVDTLRFTVKHRCSQCCAKVKTPGEAR